MPKISLFFIYFFFLCLPFSLKTIFFAPDSYLSGKFNPYVAFFLYFNDLNLLAAFFFWGINLFRQKNKIKLGHPRIILLLIVFLLLSEISILISGTEQINTFLHLFRFIELVIFYLLIINLPLKINYLLGAIIIAFSFQSFLSIFQYFRQKSIGLFFLGESNLNLYEPGIAKINILNDKFIRGYGTLPHPNILGGLLAISLLLTCLLFKKYKKIALVLFLLQIIGLISTFSRSALLAFFLGLIIYFLNQNLPKIKKIKIFSLITAILIIFLLLLQPFLFRPSSFGAEFKERLLYYQISFKMAVKNPFGIGLSEFTNQMQNYTSLKLLPWHHQPIHNLFFLISNETGLFSSALLLVSFIFILRFLFISQKKFLSLETKKLNQTLLAVFSAIFILANFDHYFFTNYQAQFIFMFILFLLNKSLIDSKTKIKAISP